MKPTSEQKILSAGFVKNIINLRYQKSTYHL
jgi:hypothetical protein